MQNLQYAEMRNGWTEEAFRRFWHRMGEIFGKPWYEKNGPEPNASWCASLVGLQLKQIAGLIEHYRKSGDQAPPNLSQVVSMAKQMKKQSVYIALPKPRPDYDAIEDRIRKLRSILS